LKDFLKHISVYGVLPVIGKFAGFFLVPIYARVFSSYEFGIVELLVTLASFLMFACNLEFYTAIGRFFYDREALHEKKKLISTGLFLTLIFTVLVIILSFVFEDLLFEKYFEGGDYHFEYRISLVWLFFSALYTYLGIIPRYDKKPKLFVLITAVSLLIRIGSTILYVLVFDAGVAGVIYGHITGSAISTILNGIVSWKYLGFVFNWQDAKEIIRFSVPIVPGLLLIGLWNPLSRSLVSKFFSIETVGLLSFAVRITSVMAILNSAIHLAWNPLLFENYKKDTFKADVYRISRLVSVVALFGSIVLTLLSPEICIYIGTPEYAESAILIGFLALNGSLEVLTRMRGFGPLVQKKTYLLTATELIRTGLGVALLFVLQNKLGLIGIGLAFIIPSFVKYILLVFYTSNNIEIKFHSFIELFLLILLGISMVSISLSVNMISRISVLALITIVVFMMLRHMKVIKIFIR
ncbi:MAG TPA: oligosaccharide flippase family protein, partial [Candidatus Cloacimonadota bacterium]|nr:oligosaccharide flippase family protein [Candidatus Cloacimonadota bacterium]